MTQQAAQAIRTQTVVWHPIYAAFLKAEEILGPNREWTSDTPFFNNFFHNAFLPSRDEIGSIPEIESVASFDAAELNKFLARRGFNISLNPFTQPDEFGVASVLELLLQWKVRGTQTRLLSKSEREFPAVSMDRGNIDVLGVPGYNHPIISIPTTTSDQVFLVLAQDWMLDRSSNLRGVGRNIVEWAYGGHVYRDRLEKVHFPMVDLDVQPDVSWLINTHTRGADGKPAVITQAKQQTKFAMDHIGALVKSGFAMGVTRGGISIPKIYKIDQPFYVVVNRPRVKEPIFTGLIGEEHWKQPVRKEN